MKKFALLFTLVIALSIVLTACGAPATTAPSATEAIQPDTQTPPTVPPAATEAPAKAFRVAVIMPSTINDLAFAQSMYDALLKVQTDMGGPSKLEIAKSEKVFTADDAASAMRDYAKVGS